MPKQRTSARGIARGRGADVFLPDTPDQNVGASANPSAGDTENQGSSQPVIQKNRKPENQGTGQPKLKRTFMLTVEEDTGLDELKLKLRRRGQNVDKNDLLREAIGLLLKHYDNILTDQ